MTRNVLSGYAVAAATSCGATSARDGCATRCAYDEEPKRATMATAATPRPTARRRFEMVCSFVVFISAVPFFGSERVVRKIERGRDKRIPQKRYARRKPSIEGC